MDAENGVGDAVVYCTYRVYCVVRLARDEHGRDVRVLAGVFGDRPGADRTARAMTDATGVTHAVDGYRVS